MVPLPSKMNLPIETESLPTKMGAPRVSQVGVQLIRWDIPWDGAGITVVNPFRFLIDGYEGGGGTPLEIARDLVVG